MTVSFSGVNEVVLRSSCHKSVQFFVHFSLKAVVVVVTFVVVSSSSSSLTMLSIRSSDSSTWAWTSTLVATASAERIFCKKIQSRNGGREKVELPCRINLACEIYQRPLYTRTGFQYIIPLFLMRLLTKNFFVHYPNDSTLTFIDDQPVSCQQTKYLFHCYKKHLKWKGVMKTVSPIIQCSMNIRMQNVRMSVWASLAKITEYIWLVCMTWFENSMQIKGYN